MNKTNDCLMIGSYICGLNSELFLHTDKNHSFFAVKTNKCRKAFAFDFVSVHVCSLHKFRKELVRSLTNGNHFSSLCQGFRILLCLTKK